MKLILILSTALIVFLFNSCIPTIDFGINLFPPKCEVTNIEEYDGSSMDFSKFAVTVKNEGFGRAYSTECDVILIKGDTVVDRSYSDFGELDSGDSLKKELWFTKVVNQTQYDSYEITLYWYDDDGNDYSKEY